MDFSPDDALASDGARDAGLDFSSGFAGSTSILNFNGSAQISGTRARITNGGFLQVGSVWSKTGRYPQVQLSIYVSDYLTD